MIQILGLRPYTTAVGDIKIAEKFFNKKWRAESVPILFRDLESIIAPIPEKERWNLYYTVSNCHEAPGRKLKEQFIIPFDIDDIDLERIEEYIQPCLKAIGVKFNETGIVYSGNGLQFIIQSTHGFDSASYFREVRHHYKIICERINNVLHTLRLPGKADNAVWGPSRLMRLPGTENIKTPEAGFANKNSKKKATCAQRHIEPVDYRLDVASGLPILEKNVDYIDCVDAWKTAPPDTEAVLEGCLFLKECKENQTEVTEENWYKMLSIVARVENGPELCHEYSKEDKKRYSQHGCQQKLEQALNAAGPRTCRNIHESFNCVPCPNFGKEVTPIALKGPKFIETRNNGFRQAIKNKKGDVTGKGVVHLEDLRRFFELEHDYMTCTDKSVYTWKETHWERMDDAFIDHFVEKNVDPPPYNKDCSEFRSKIQRTNLVLPTFFEDSTFGKMNLKNGVLDLSKGEPVLLPHSKQYGFMSTLNYDYDPKATCKAFDKYIKEVTLNRIELEKILLEFAGYSFANEQCKHAKSLILLGDGRNGKSTFMDVLMELAGDTACSAIPLTKFQDEKFVATLQGKLFNMTEETPKKAFMDSSVFKTLVSGGVITARHLYKTPFTMKNRTKIILACNELPNSEDMTTGMIRRLLIVPFEGVFENSTDNKNLKEELFLELPGILNRIIKGYLDLKKQMNFTSSSVVDKEVEEFRLDNDSIFFFRREYLKINDGMPKPWTSSKEIYDRYRDYCDDNGIKYNLTLQRFFTRLKRYIPDLPKRRKRRGENKTTGYEGIEMAKTSKKDF